MANQDYYNRYGMGKVEETDVRSNLNIAAGTASMAAQGAQAGAQFAGVPGAIVGTAAGGTMGLIAGIEGRADEQIMAAADRSRNAGIDNLTGRDFRTQRVTPDQLEKGMNTGKYMMAEIEGGDQYRRGIGEIVVDKNFNEKYDAAGDPTHEEGGKDVMLEAGDSVFDTQNSEKQYRMVKRDLRLAKMGNSKALERLKKRRDALPTDEDYDKAEQQQEAVRARYGMRTYEDGVGSVGPYTNPGGSRNTRQFETEEEKRKRLEREARKKERKETQELRKDRRYLRENERFHDVSQKAERLGTIRDQFRKKDKLMTDGVPVLEDWESKRGLKDYIGDAFDTGKGGDQEGQTAQSPYEGYSPGQDPQEAPKGTATNLGAANKGKEAIEKGEKGEKFRNFTDPLKYASVATNALMGMQPAEEVTRRYASADEYDYRDTSAAKRRSTMEARNAQNRMLRGRVDRSGSIGTNAQVQAQYMGQMEGINEAESAKQLATDQANTQLRNQVAQQNVKYDIGYDEMDAQNRAARQEFKGTAAAEAAELAQYNEQRRYMQQLDKRQYARDQDILDKGLLQSSDFEWASDGTIRYTGSSYKPTTENPYTRESRTRSNTRRTTIPMDTDNVSQISNPNEKSNGIYVTKKKSNRKKRGRRMMPDGTII